MLFKLPKYVFYIVSSEFLSKIELCLLDTAVCSHAHRTVLLSLLTTNLTSKTLSDLNGSVKYHIWCDGRKVPTRHLKVNLVRENCNTLQQRISLMTILRFSRSSKVLDNTYRIPDKFWNQITPKIILLNLERSISLSFSDFKLIFNRCRQLERLSLQGCLQVTDEVIVSLAKACKLLCSLNLKECHQITDDAICAMTESHKLRLTSLNALSCHKLTNYTLTAIQAYCPNLTELRLGKIKTSKYRTMSGDDTTIKIDYQTLAEKCTKLRVIQLVDSLSHETTELLSHCCKQLEFFDVGFGLFNENIFFTDCPQLRTLIFHHRYCPDIQLNNIANNCTNLTKLNISDFIACDAYCDSIRNLSQKCVLLKSLTIKSVNSECRFHTETLELFLKHCQLSEIRLMDFAGISRCLNPTVCCEMLIQLLRFECYFEPSDFGNINVRPIPPTQDYQSLLTPSLQSLHVIAIIQSNLIHLSSVCVSLTELQLPHCHVLTNTIMKQVLSLVGKQMVKLNLRNCSQLSKFTWSVLSRVCENLECLDVGQCRDTCYISGPKLSKTLQFLDISISPSKHYITPSCSALIPNCTYLSCLNLKGLNVTHNNIVNIVNGCPRLKYFSLHSCHTLYDNSIVYIATYCKGLYMLDISYCMRHLSDLSVNIFLTECLTLKELRMYVLDKNTSNLIYKACLELDRLRAGLIVTKHVNSCYFPFDVIL